LTFDIFANVKCQALTLVLVAAVAGAREPLVVKQVVSAEAAAANRIDPAGWRAWEHEGRWESGIASCDNGTNRDRASGTWQEVKLDQPEPRPIVARAWSRAEAVGGGRDGDYSLYLDLYYRDGDHEWGLIAPFRTGTHDWEKGEVTFLPRKPVARVNFHLLLRRHSGKAWFKDAALHEVVLPGKACWFDGIPVVQPGRAAEGFAVRDVAAASDFVAFDRGRAFGLELSFDRTTRDGVTWVRGRVKDTTGGDRAVTLVYTVPAPAGPWRWLDNPRRETPAAAPAEYASLVRVGAGATGGLSRFPLAAVAGEREGRAIALDMGLPALFRTGFSAGTGELHIAYDLGLTPEKHAAEFGFCVFPFNPAGGFRSALARFHAAFPDYFRCRTPEQGLWMPFTKISEVAGWQDFWFKFKEGNDEVPWDDAHGILTFRYTEPMTWWMPMPKEMPRTIEAAVAEARRLASEGNPNARALLASGFHDESGAFTAKLLNTPWTDGAVWSMNSSPSVTGNVTDFGNKWNATLRDELYGPARKGDLDGEYVDSSEGYVTDELDFRRDHFATARTPLTFALDSRRPAVYRWLIAWEYVKQVADDVHVMERFSMANGTPDRVCWLAPWLDVLGTETDWNPDGRWEPMSRDELLYRRALCGPKPYCFLMNTDFTRFPHALVEKYMKRCLAYGMYPGFFSHNASDSTYFSQPALYNRDRPLFRKYVPLCKLAGEAGWDPEPQARSSDPAVWVESFGRKYLTVFNDSAEPKRVTITLDQPVSKPARELVTGASLAWSAGKLELALGPEDVAVVER